MGANVSLPLVRELKERLANLSLQILGQHLWSIRMGYSSESTGCICLCCEEARKSYQAATGVWPTKEQEHSAMRIWGHGK